MHYFNFEKELEAVKIPIPFVEVARKPIFKKHISYFVSDCYCRYNEFVRLKESGHVGASFLGTRLNHASF